MNTDAPILPAAVSLADLVFAAVKPDGTEVKVSASALLGVLASDVDASVATGDTIASRLNVVVGTTPTVTLPSVSGAIRNVIVINTASGNATLDTPGSEKILTGTAEADTLVLATGTRTTLVSDGTRWYNLG